MKKNFFYFLIVMLLCASVGRSQNKSQSIKYLKSNLEFLSSDELEGRETTTRGEKIASLFISKELEKYGVEPFGDNGTYFQNFNMVVISNDEEKTNLILESKDGTAQELNIKDDFTLSKSHFPSISFSGKKYEMIFAGYGVESQEENYSDYKDLDVKGKIVVVVRGTPLESQKYIRATKLSSLKRDFAESHGAAGIIQLIGKNPPYPWVLIKRYLNSPSFKLEDELKEMESNKNIPSFIFSPSSAEKLFDGEKYSFDKIDEMAEKNDELKSFSFNKEIDINFAFNKEIKPTRNVIGVIEGTDEKLKNEYVTIGAHFDHLGMHNGQIYNGADDNGSGTTSVLELARLLAKEKKNKRSIVLAFHTGEEKGLKGAKYLTNHSDNIIKNAVVNINIDMVGRESTDTLFNVGSGRLSKELYNLVREVNSQSVNFVLDYKFDNPNDPQDIYNRSDHKHYADKGIPVVFFFDEMREDYHKPTDTVDKINFDKMYKVVELSEALAIKIANLDHKLKVDNQLKLKKDEMEKIN